MKTQSSPMFIVDCLTRLRGVLGPERKQTNDQITWQNGIYIEALQDLQPQHLKAATTDWIRTGDKFPKPAELRRLAVSYAERQEAQASLDAKHRQDDAKAGAEARNEVIMLLGGIDCVARRHFGNGDGVLGAKSEGYQRFVGEAARLWARVRPANGLPGLDEMGHREHGAGGRFRYGCALAAWARQYLGLRPLAPAYLVPSVLAAYRHLTGEDLAVDEVAPASPAGDARRLAREVADRMHP